MRAGRRWPTAVRTGLLCAVALLLVVLSAGGARAQQEAPPPRPDKAGTLLLGLIVDGDEVDVVDVWFDGSQFWLPLESFARLCRCRLETGASRVRILTPLGEQQLSGDEDLVLREGTRFVAERALAQRLAVTLRYEPSLMALLVDLPWLRLQPGSTDGRRNGAEPIDMRPPAASLGAVSSQLHYARQGSAASAWGTARLIGRAGGGVWRLRYQEGAGTALNEYLWGRQFARGGLLGVGYQRVAVHPLLGSLELTGAQLGWTNQPLDLFPARPEEGSLLPRQLRTRTDIVGPGIPAGIAVLRVNDRPVAAQTIPLDGVYRFDDVPLNPSQFNRIEVFVYDRHDLQVPALIRDHSRRASETMLPAGALVTLAGAGAHGNLLDAQLGERPPVGFFQLRYGLVDAVTVEAAGALQQTGASLAAGAIARLGRSLVASVAGAYNAGRLGYAAEVEGERGPWRLQASSRLRWLTAAALAPEPLPDSDQRFELSHRWRAAGLEIGLVGRLHAGSGGDVRFLLPTLSWNPAYRVFLLARPDLDGAYRFDASWGPAARWRLGFSHSRGATTLDASWAATDRLRLSAFAQTRGADGQRAALLLGWSSGASGGVGLTAGPLWTNGRPGAIARFHVEILPGVLLAAQYESDTLAGVAGGRREHRVSLDLATSLAFAGRRLIPSRQSALRLQTGGVGGRLVVQGGYPIAPERLAGIMLRIDGRTAVATEAGGRFLIPALPPGVYRLSLDPAGLPIELTPERDSLVVQVAAGAVTRVQFTLRVEFGIAGRVEIAGERLAGVRVDLLDADGRVAATTRTDRFGLYRFDNVPVGSWRVRLSPANAPEQSIRWPERAVLVRDDFVFGQDLVLELPGTTGGERLRERIEAAAQAAAAAFAARVRGLGQELARWIPGGGAAVSMGVD